MFCNKKKNGISVFVGGGEVFSPFHGWVDRQKRRFDCFFLFVSLFFFFFLFDFFFHLEEVCVVLRVLVCERVVWVIDLSGVVSFRWFFVFLQTSNPNTQKMGHKSPKFKKKSSKKKKKEMTKQRRSIQSKKKKKESRKKTPKTKRNQETEDNHPTPPKSQNQNETNKNK